MYLEYHTLTVTGMLGSASGEAVVDCWGSDLTSNPSSSPITPLLQFDLSKSSDRPGLKIYLLDPIFEYRMKISYLRCLLDWNIKEHKEMFMYDKLEHSAVGSSDPVTRCLSSQTQLLAIILRNIKINTE